MFVVVYYQFACAFAHAFACVCVVATQGGALQGMAAEVAALHASTADLTAGSGAVTAVAQAALEGVGDMAAAVAALNDRTAALEAAREAQAAEGGGGTLPPTAHEAAVGEALEQQQQHNQMQPAEVHCRRHDRDHRQRPRRRRRCCPGPFLRCR